MIPLLYYRDVMDQIASALEGQHKGWEGVNYVRIDGSTDSLDRRKATQRFRDDPTISVALLSITAAGVLLHCCILVALHLPCLIISICCRVIDLCMTDR